ncbi:ABC transporter ATP-binding protein [Kistimonas asteriae]|uniref:ABC transporter ATP-binding protein n=1 Tax=Kistimonas asteriae TaxID=517724 RepID=UPI0031B8789F
MTILQMDNVVKQFDTLKALQGISLSLEEGEVLGLFGHNGAGKSTSMKLILGLLSPDEGEISVFGEQPDQKGFRQQRHRIGFLQENVSFYEQLTGLEVLLFFARLKGYGRKMCLELLERLGLAHAVGRKVGTWSKGMRQRLGLAQALLGEPKLLLLDEPTVGLDPSATQDFYGSVAELKAQGCSVILCSHVLPGVERYIDRAAIMGQGRVLAQGELETLRAQADLPVSVLLEGENLLQQLPDDLKALAQGTREQAGRLQLQGRADDKLKLLRGAATMPGLTDIQWRVPNLEDLYNHFSRECLQETRQ